MTIVLINIISGVCILLWGLREVRQGISRAAGARLRNIISVGTKNRISAFFSGMGVTAILQSSTATALILSGFASQGLVRVEAGIAAMLGADVGTTLVAQLLSSNLTLLLPLLIISGFFLYSKYAKTGNAGHMGRFLFGLGLMLLALGWIKDAVEPLKHSENLPYMLSLLETEPLMAILLASIITWLMHSSLAFVLLVVSFVTGDLLPVPLAFALVLGANLGAVFASILATSKDGPVSRRIPVSNLLIRIAGVLVCLPLIALAVELVQVVDPDPARMIVNFHTGFNLILAIVFLPLVGLVSKISAKFIPEKVDQEDPSVPKYLDENAIDSPVVALTAAMRETLRVADVIQAMLEDTMTASRTDNEKLIREVRAQDDIVDNIYKAIKMYMARITQESLDPKEATHYMQVLTFATNLEHVGDLIDRSMASLVLKKIRNQKRFSREGWREIKEVHNYVVETMRLAQNVLASNDITLARKLVERKADLRVRVAEATHAHFERIRHENHETIATSSIHLDLIRDYRNINGYMCATAYPILETEGLLRETRLLPEETLEEKA